VQKEINDLGVRVAEEREEFFELLELLEEFCKEHDEVTRRLGLKCSHCGCLPTWRYDKGDCCPTEFCGGVFRVRINWGEREPIPLENWGKILP